MRLSGARLAPKPSLRWPRRSARLRLTILYGGLFLLSGIALLAATYALFQRATQYRTPPLPKIPHAPDIQDLQSPLTQALVPLYRAQRQLAKAKTPLGAVAFTGPNRLVQQPFPLRQSVLRAQHQLAQAQHQLTQAQQQLSRAVHQVERAGSLQAVQRAADSHQLLVDSGIALAIVAVLAILAGWLVAGRMLRPIRTITRTARKISSTNLHERLALDGPADELKELGDTLDDLFARLEAAFEAQRHFVANASHELRTPLTRERTLVQVALGDPSTSEVWRSTGQELLASNRGQENLIEALLTLASSEGGLEHRERIDLAEACRTVLARPDLDRDRPGLQVETVIRSAPLDGDPRLVEQLVANLVDNAIVHNVDGGRVQVSTGVKGGRAVLSVANSGPLVPPGEVDRLFQPFQRLDGRRANRGSGHGLGLCIVRAIATAHHGKVAAVAPPDGGLLVTVIFPSPPDLHPGGH